MAMTVSLGDLIGGGVCDWLIATVIGAPPGDTQTTLQLPL
jgi:hypothetical protein